MSEIDTQAIRRDNTQSASDPAGQHGVPRGAADPLFILGLPRSFSSVVSAMVGQHPQMYGLPELHLFSAETIADWCVICSRATFPMSTGLLRAVAQLHFGEQTQYTITKADGWLRRRLSLSTGLIFETLADRVHPLILVEKSPGIVYQIEFMQRAYNMFPQARFLHLVRHPRGYGQSVIAAIKETAKFGPVPSWLLWLASCRPFARHTGQQRTVDLDPQRGWYFLHMNICQFLQSVPNRQKLRICGEHLLTDPDRSLLQIASWLGLRTDSAAIEKMKHPEESPYACIGPPNARFGNDASFLKSPAIRPDRVKPQSLDGPLGWCQDSREFSPAVRQLAKQFGYD